VYYLKGGTKMNNKLKDEAIDNLFNAILQLKNIDECYLFFEDIGTVGEIKALAQRLEVAKMLKEGHKYGDIADATGVSTATISRVSRCLNYGADGYNLVLDRINKKD